jgi:UDP-N-acetylmuramoylalanine--D-glutamate ligase
MSGAAAARALRSRGAEVTVVDADPIRAGALRDEGFVVVDVTEPPPGTFEVVTSPGWRPSSPLLVAAQRARVPVIGEVELARRVGGPDGPAWLAVTGTNGKTTTTTMLEAVLRAAGHRTVSAGNTGLPLVEAVTGPYDVLAVELSSFQLHWSPEPRPHTAAVLNIADDHVDWHGSLVDYALTTSRVWDGATAVGNLDDPATAQLLGQAVGRTVGFTLRVPRPGEVGLVEDLLVDRAFPDVEGEATELATFADLMAAGPHNVANALAAAAVARSYGVPAHAVRDGLRGVVP